MRHSSEFRPPAGLMKSDRTKHLPEKAPVVPAQIALRTLGHLDTERGNGCRMNGTPDVGQHLNLRMDIRVSADAGRMHQTPGEDKRGKKSVKKEESGQSLICSDPTKQHFVLGLE